jgi:predicted phage baseplate assembly protein
MKKDFEVCRDQSERRRDIRKHTNAAGKRDLNGIDYLKVNEQQTVLTVYFLGHAPADITETNVRIDGGARIRDIKVKRIYLCDPKDPRVDGCLQIEVDRPGDFSTYTLRLVETDAHGLPGNEPLEGFDPRYAQLDFSFKASCSTDLDCVPADTCASSPLEEPEINYLGKDYASFRQLILDRLSLIMPDWKERHVPDLGIALVELLAYVGDYLSYYQDAVATEAYLDTARQRISVRRHAKLVDYAMHEGCNARAWVYVEASDDRPLGGIEDVYFISSTNRSFGQVLTSDDLRDIPFSEYEVFEPVVQQPDQPLQFYVKHNDISFYTWHERECCLPRGATSATLIDEWAEEEEEEESEPYAGQQSYGEDSAPYGQSATRTVPGKAQKRVIPYAPKKLKERDPYAEPEDAYAREDPYAREDSYAREDPYAQTPRPKPPRGRLLHLKVGDVLIFEEMLGPVTGVKADADPAHRHVVRLTSVKPGIDTLYDQPIVEIEWAVEDALPFPLCISAIGRAPDCQYLKDVSVAHGNVLLVDHGRRIGSTRTEEPESWEVPALPEQDAGCFAEGEPRETLLLAAPLRPRLKHEPLTYRAPFPKPSLVARQQFHLLSRLMMAVRARIEKLWTEARDGRPLSDDEIEEILAIFGDDALPLTGTSSYLDQARLLRKLLAHDERLLAKKARRVKSLATRALAGYVLRETEQQELAEMLGAFVVGDIGLGGSQLLGPASLALMQDPREALPGVTLDEQQLDSSAPDKTSRTWTPQLELLESNAQDRNFVVEIDNSGRAYLRFGDGDLGRVPIPGTTLTATYRVGNGTRGNVGAEAISHFVFRKPTSGSEPRVRNPMPAQGGVDPEPMSEAKLFAPMAFRGVERAVTAEDYALLAQRSAPAKIQRAVSAPLRWTGSWYEVAVAIDPFGSEVLDQNLREEVEGYLYRYRRIGHDLRVRAANYIPLEVMISVCVLPHYLRAHIEAELLDLFSNRTLSAGKLGFFHPNNLSFGEGIHLSKLVALAQSVTGVESVRVTTLQRLFEDANQEIENGILPLGPLEVARLDNDRSFPERGKLFLDVRGGR